MNKLMLSLLLVIGFAGFSTEAMNSDSRPAKSLAKRKVAKKSVKDQDARREAHEAAKEKEVRAEQAEKRHSFVDKLRKIDASIAKEVAKLKADTSIATMAGWGLNAFLTVKVAGLLAVNSARAIMASHVNCAEIANVICNVSKTHGKFVITEPALSMCQEQITKAFNCCWMHNCL